MNQLSDDLRFERKAYVDNLDRHAVIAFVRRHPALFREVHNERIVNSLYFDTRNLSNAMEKINGLKSRRKARIRWYGLLFGEIPEPVLEIKAKENNLGWKMRCSLHPFIFENRCNASIQPEFRETEEAVLQKMLMMTRIPSSLVSYRRIYFLSADGRFRLTVDDKMQFYRPGKNNRGWVLNGDNPRGCVIELKYSQADDAGAPDVTSWFPFRWGAFSKYIAGLESVN